MGAVLTILIVLITGRTRRTQGARGPRGYATFAPPPPRLIKVDPTQTAKMGMRARHAPFLDILTGGFPKC